MLLIKGTVDKNLDSSQTFMATCKYKRLDNFAITF